MTSHRDLFDLVNPGFNRFLAATKRIFLNHGIELGEVQPGLDKQQAIGHTLIVPKRFL